VCTTGTGTHPGVVEERVGTWWYTYINIYIPYTLYYTFIQHYIPVHIHTYIHEGKDEAMASGRVIFQSVAGRESGVIVLVVSFAIFIFTRPDFRDFLRSIRSVQNYNRFLVYLTSVFDDI
jgi:hypothetical protein